MKNKFYVNDELSTNNSLIESYERKQYTCTINFNYTFRALEKIIRILLLHECDL